MAKDREQRAMNLTQMVILTTIFSFHCEGWVKLGAEVLVGAWVWRGR